MPVHLGGHAPIRPAYCWVTDLTDHTPITAAQGANTSRAAAWRVRAARTPTDGGWTATAGRVAKGWGVGGACLARVQGPFVTVDFIIGEVFDYLHGRYYGARLSTRAPDGRV